MADRLPDNHIEGGGEASSDALSVVIRELGISPEMEQLIRKLQGTKKEDCIISLEDIAKEVKEKNIGNTDRDKKIRETLASEYGIISMSSELKNNTVMVPNNGSGSKEISIQDKIARFKERTVEDDEKYKKLAENLSAVKNLDKTIVEEELQKAKSIKPLPEGVRTNISKATGIPEQGIDEAIKSGSNPLLNNLVDTYYLTSARDSIEKRIPEGKKGAFTKAFSELEASARDYGVLAEFRSKDLETKIADKSNRSQELILSGAKSITQGRGDIPVIREGEQLIFKSPDGKEVTHTMDISKIPPEVTKIKGALRVSYSLSDTKEQEKQAGYKKALESSKKESQGISEEIENTHKGVQDNLKKVEQNVINIEEFSSLINSLRSPLTTEKKKENTDRIIQLCSIGEYSGVFEPKTELKGEELVTQDGYRDYFFGQRLRATELRKKLNTIGELEGKIKPSKGERTTEEYEQNIRENLDKLSDLGIDQFSSMEEVTAFLMSQNGPEVGNKWGDAESINSFLGVQKIESSQLIKMLTSLTRIHDNIAGTKASELPNNAKISVLMRPEGNGIPRIINSLRNFKVLKNGGSTLTQSNFNTLLSSSTNSSQR